MTKTTYTIEQIAKMDEEMHELQAQYSRAKIYIGLELAKRLKAFDNGELYKKLDERSYPNFPKYLESIGVNYKTAREIIGLYEAYVLVAGFTIRELAEYGYSRLTVLKPKFFKRENGEYLLTESMAELNKWLVEAKSDITNEDLRQKIREDRAGEHQHDWQRISFQVCKICRLKETIYNEKKEEQK